MDAFDFVDDERLRALALRVARDVVCSRALSLGADSDTLSVTMGERKSPLGFATATLRKINRMYGFTYTGTADVAEAAAHTCVHASDDWLIAVVESLRAQMRVRGVDIVGAYTHGPFERVESVFTYFHRCMVERVVQ